MRGKLSTAITAVILALAGTTVLADPLPARPKLYDPATPMRVPRRSSLSVPPAAAADTDNTCTTTTFEGLGDLAPIPDFDNVSFPGWLSIIEEGVGGSGRFAGEPSPVTIAFWLYGNPYAQDILFDNPVAKVGMYYASYVGVQLTAFDADGNVLDNQFGAPNWDEVNQYYDIWTPISVQAQGNRIAKVTLYGEANYTGIDDLQVCRRPTIHSVEVTQAIQEWQTIEDLEAALNGAGEPPVPIVSNKPAALRVYYDELQETTSVTVEATLPGGAMTQTVALQAACTPEDARRNRNACPSVDFFFTPPSGSWTATVVSKDAMGQQIEQHDLTFQSRDVNSLVLRSVTTCDDQVGGTWQCADGSALAALPELLRLTAPTDKVRVDTTNNFVRLKADANNDGVVSDTEADNWWANTAKQVDAMYGLWDWLVAQFGEQRYYFGMVRPSGLGGTGGMAHDIPSHGAIGRTSATRLGVETNREVVAHETGHMLGLRHTNTDVPVAGGSPPGCYNLAQDPGTDWPFADNYIQSTTRLEVGFNLSDRKPVLPETHFDWMSYCTPRWISPFSYRKVLSALGGGAGPVAPASIVTTGPFWTVSGRIDANVATLDPMFLIDTQGPTDSGAGTYQIRVTDGSHTVLFTRYFTPALPEPETQGPPVTPIPVFFELVPFQATAAHIGIIDPSDTEIGGLDLGGTPPAVSIQFPAGGEMLNGHATVQWSVVPGQGLTQQSWVEYSPDAGGHWYSLGQLVDAEQLDVDFGALPGSMAGAALIRVYASDGANTGSSTSNGFTVGRKLPQATIQFPANGAAFRLGDLTWLQGSVFDGDDGYLDGAAVTWTSDKDGTLGHGASLPIYSLSSGAHKITLSGTDSDGNSVSTSVNIAVGTGRPSVLLTADALDQAPTTCELVSVSALPGSDVVGLSAVQYSIDGGSTWMDVPLDALPYSFIAPGQGFFHVLAHAIDVAGQTDAQDVRFFTAAQCQGIDSDGDGVPNAVDNCPYVLNLGQEDTGGIGATSGPDGIGDACQCGDVNGNGRLTVADSVIILRSLLTPPTATQTKPELCDVGGSAGCSLADAVIMLRANLSPPTATVVQQCAPAVAPAALNRGASRSSP